MAETNTSLIKIGASNYDIQEKFLEIFKNHFNIDDHNLLRTGLLGYLNEVMSQIARDGVFHRDFLYNELFLNTANLPKSIYNWAKLYNYDISKASPAKMTVSFAIRKQDVIDFSTPVDGSGILREFVISRDDYFYAEDYKFMLDHSVRILLKRMSDGDYALTAQYLLDDGNSHVSSLVTPYVKTWIETINNKRVFFMVLDIYQMEKNSIVYNVFTEDLAEALMYEYEYKNQLANFQVEYDYAGETVRLDLIFNNTVSPTSQKYCFFTYPSDQKLLVYFSGIVGEFAPKFNSKLRLVTYTTLGQDGNFQYVGDLAFKFSDKKIESTALSVKPMTDSAGGRNRPDLTQLKKNLINQVLIRNNLITELDLNNFFAQVVETSTVYGSTLTFIKQVDDIFRRVFSAFLLMRNSAQQEVPTNTIDIVTDETKLEEMGMVVRSGMIVTNALVSGPGANPDSYRFLQDGELPESLVGRQEESVYAYSIPFLIDVKFDPFPKVSYILNLCEQRAVLDYAYVNSRVNYEFLVPFVDFERMNFFEDFYDLDLALVTNYPTASLQAETKVRCMLFNGDTPYGYFDFEKDDPAKYPDNVNKDFIYVAKLLTDNSFNAVSDMSLTSCLRRASIAGIAVSDPAYDGALEAAGIPAGRVIPKTYIGERLSVKVAVLIKDVPTELGKAYEDTSTNADAQVFLRQPDMTDWSVAAVLSSHETVSLFKKMSQVMYSDIVHDDNGNVVIKKVPCVYVEYFNKVQNYQEFYRLFMVYEDVLKSNIKKLENNTSLDLKFYNTYGPCRNSTIGNVNLKLGFRIKLAPETYSVQLDTDIKNTIVSHVRRANTELDGLISISNICKELENAFDEIRYIEFVRLNEFTLGNPDPAKNVSSKQKIEYLFQSVFTMESSAINKEQLIRFVPEFINVPVNKGFDVDDAGIQLFDPDITISYI